ncbi:MAG: formate/nitrite transporter family protein [bacterium]
MDITKIDAYSPAEMEERIEAVGAVKAKLDFLSMFSLAILAGAFISFGAVFFTFVAHDSSLGFVPSQLLGGLCFSLGLILVIVAGAELFTGNNLIVMSFVSRKITLWQLLRNWTIVYLGNFAGALTMVMWIYLSMHWTAHQNLVGAKALAIASAKVSLPFVVAFTRGILCNALVCLAVWLCASGRSVTDKILSVIFPITAFVALGFEHCIANMYFIPMGLILKGEPSILEAAGIARSSADALSNLTVAGFLYNNLLPVTLGNIIGGSVMVGLIYWSVYHRVRSK